MKRFYDNVAVMENADGTWQVTLDGRPIRTVKGAHQAVPAEALARLLATEWDIESDELDPKTFVHRDMADYAIDVIAQDRPGHVTKLLGFAETDTLLYRADPDDAFHKEQHALWEPLVTTFEAREGIALTRVSGIMPRAQPRESLAALEKRLAALGPFALAAVEMLASLAASLTVALSAVEAEDEEDALALWRAACLEEEWQAEQWGRDPEAEDRRADRQRRFLKAWAFARAARAGDAGEAA